MKPESESALSHFFKPPAWTTGHISLEDAALLAELIEGRPKGPVVEIGVASGWSSAVLLHLLSRESDSEQVWLHSYDVSDRCYFDPSRQVGEAVGEVVPALVPHWRLHLGDAEEAMRQHRSNPVELAFIDADHRHPWPTLDLLALLPALAPDAWVALHDINLPAISTKPEWRVFGPKHLFDLWPWEKRVAAGSQRNIGAVRVPSDHAAVHRFCSEVLERAWETAVGAALLDRLGVPAAVRQVPPTAAACPLELARHVTAAQMQNRAVIIWGAGGGGRACLAALLDRGVLPDAFVDRDEAKHGRLIDGVPVRALSALTDGRARPFVIVASMHVAEIEAELQRLGFVAPADFARFEIGEPSATSLTAPAPQGTLLGMTTGEEQEYLLQYARDEYTGSGAIVDLGSWLGSTTIPLARGLKEAGAPQRIVHSYDTFVWHPWMDRYAGDLAGRFRQGDSFLPEFQRRLGPLAARVRVHPGDLTVTKWADGPIEFLLVDAMKNWPLCSAISREFLAAVIPGAGQVMHQDFKFWGCPWIHLTTYRMRESLEIEQDLSSSAGTVFRLVRPLDLAMFGQDLSARSFTRAEIDAAYAYWMERMDGPLVWQLECARILVLSEIGDEAAVLAGIEKLLDQDRDLPDRLLDEVRLRIPSVALSVAAEPWRTSVERARTGGRPIYLWGAGAGGRRLLELEPDLRAAAAGVIDSSVAKHGSDCGGLPIVPPSTLDQNFAGGAFVVVATSFGADVAKALRQRGFTKFRDFCVAGLG